MRYEGGAALAAAGDVGEPALACCCDDGWFGLESTGVPTEVGLGPGDGEIAGESEIDGGAVNVKTGAGVGVVPPPEEPIDCVVIDSAEPAEPPGGAPAPNVKTGLEVTAAAKAVGAGVAAAT